MQWLKENIWTIVIALVLAAVVVSIAVARLKRKRGGRGGCASCGSRDSCPMRDKNKP